MRNRNWPTRWVYESMYHIWKWKFHSEFAAMGFLFSNKNKMCSKNVNPIRRGRWNFANWFGDNKPGCLWATKINKFFHGFKCDIWPSRCLFLWPIGTQARYRQIIWRNLNRMFASLWKLFVIRSPLIIPLVCWHWPITYKLLVSDE